MVLPQKINVYRKFINNTKTNLTCNQNVMILALNLDHFDGMNAIESVVIVVKCYGNIPTKFFNIEVHYQNLMSLKLLSHVKSKYLTLPSSRLLKFEVEKIT